MMFVNGIKCNAVNMNEADYRHADAIVLMLCKECVPAIEKLLLPQNIGKTVSAYLALHDDIFEPCELRSLVVDSNGKLQLIVIVGCGCGNECEPNNFRKAAGVVSRELQIQKISKAVLAAPILLNNERAHYLQAIAEGLYLGAYKFTEYKSDAKKTAGCSVTVVSTVNEAVQTIGRAEIIASGVSYARTLANRPGNAVTPEVMANEAAKAAAENGLEIEILDRNYLADKKMGAILAVGQGSNNAPYMIILKYNGAGDSPFTAYVGKGITFDSGGISIKPSANMGEMKDDMAGAWVVLSALSVIAKLKLPCNIIGILACAENMPGGTAQRPGDIVISASGKTIEVVSTDAEGRMVLADAVWYACRHGVKRVIDIATLTGAAIIALGKETACIISNNDSLADTIKIAGKMAGESYWHMPSLPECKKAIKGEIADLVNSTGREAGCITGGLFIGAFVDEGVEWAHLDIAGTSTAEKTAGFTVKGGTGFGVMTLVRLAERI
ncbi:MAG: leucyl aminopeptidase [Phascolarctobacterium sp.]|nr:leucyl aminopeptidase [Phascolarctobacterium sp.]